MRKHHGQDGSLFVQDKTMFYLESYTSPSRARTRSRVFRASRTWISPFSIPVECLQGWRKQSLDGRVIWLREEGSKMAGSFSCSWPSRRSCLTTAPSSWDYGFDKWKPHVNISIKENRGGTPGGEGATPYNGLYGEAMPERGTFFKPQVYERVGILYSLNYMKGWENLSVRSVKGPKRANRWILWLYKVEKTFFFAIDSYLKDRAFRAVKKDAKF